MFAANCSSPFTINHIEYGVSTTCSIGKERKEKERKGKERKTFLQTTGRHVNCHENKKNHTPLSWTGWDACGLSLAIIRSAVLSIRGTRSAFEKPIYEGNLHGSSRRPDSYRRNYIFISRCQGYSRVIKVIHPSGLYNYLTKKTFANVKRC